MLRDIRHQAKRSGAEQTSPRGAQIKHQAKRSGAEQTSPRGAQIKKVRRVRLAGRGPITGSPRPGYFARWPRRAILTALARVTGPERAWAEPPPGSRMNR